MSLVSDGSLELKLCSDSVGFFDLNMSNNPEFFDSGISGCSESVLSGSVDFSGSFDCANIPRSPVLGLSSELSGFPKIFENMLFSGFGDSDVDSGKDSDKDLDSGKEVRAEIAGT